MGIYKASYNRISKSSFTSPRENIKRLSEKIFSPLLIQRKNWTPLCAGKTKKTYTSTHNETRGAVRIPASSYCACMYKSLNCPFCILIFIPRPRGCSILAQKNLFVKKFLHVFFVYCGVDFNPQFLLDIQEIDALFLQEECIHRKRYDTIEGVADTE